MAYHLFEIVFVYDCKRFAQSAGPGLSTIWLFGWGLAEVWLRSGWGPAEVRLRSASGLAVVWLRSGWGLAEVWPGSGLNIYDCLPFGEFIWTHFLCFSNGLSSVFKHRFWLRKESTFGAFFHSRGSFWSHFWLMFGSFFGYFGSFFVLGRTLGALGAHFFITKTVWTTKGAPIGISPKIYSLFGSHFGVIFRVFFEFWGSVFELRFLLSSGTDFSWILASFQHNFLIFFCTCRHLWF